MKVQGNALAAYTRDLPVARTGAAEAAGEQDSRAARPKATGLNVEDFFSLSPKAQAGLVERMLMTSIGKKIGAEFGEHGIDLEKHAGEDQSPDAVSSRIADFATGMLNVFQAQNPDLGESELLNAFEETVRGAVDLGYEQANGILDTMDEVDEQTKSVGATTMELVHEKLDAFFAQRRSTSDEPSP